ncbi:MAG: LpqN/LpqT family lipoprotein [Mycobacterium sp.]
MRKYDQIALVMFASVVAALAGCSSRPPAPGASNSAVSSAQPSSSVVSTAGCAASDVPLVTLDPKASDEPKLAIPTPQGWEYSAAMNSPMIRGAVANKGLRANGFTPNAVVTLEDLTGKVQSAQQGVDAEVASVAQGGMAVGSQVPGTACGHPSTTITYTLQNRPVTALIAAVDDGPKIWAAVLTIQTTEPDNPAYLDAKKTILNGFQFQSASRAH